MEDTMSWDELYAELQPDIPFDKAKTVRQAFEDLKKKQPETMVTENFVRENLERRVRDNGWNKKKFRSSCYYWPPDVRS